MRLKICVLVSCCLGLLQNPLSAQTLEPTYDIPVLHADLDQLHSNAQSAPDPTVIDGSKLLHGSIQKRGKKETLRHASALQDKVSTQEQAGTQLRGSSSSAAAINKEGAEEEKDLKIAWDNWRNRFERAVHAKFSEQLAGGDAIYIAGITFKLGDAPVIRYAVGTKASFACEIFNDRQIRNLKITRSSGIQSFDNLILRSVQSLAGKSVLKFPKGSQRQKVAESLSLWRSRTNEFHKSEYNDIETVSHHDLAASSQ
jgi:hypothetical protein